MEEGGGWRSLGVSHRRKRKPQDTMFFVASGLVKWCGLFLCNIGVGRELSLEELKTSKPAIQINYHKNIIDFPETSSQYQIDQTSCVS